MNYKYTVLTFIFGKGYERLHEIEEVDPEVEYLLITDDEDLKSNTWKIIVDHDLDALVPFEKCFKVRYNVFKYCSTDICMTIDGSIAIKKFPRPLFEKFENDRYDICLMPHPLWSDFCSEYNAWIRMRNYPVAHAQRFFKFLTSSNYDLKYNGLFQLCFSIKRRCKTTFAADEMTFSLLKYLSKDGEFERLDQTVYSYVLNRYFNDLKVLPVSEQILRSDYMTWYWHNSDKPNLNVFYDINKVDVKYVFNKEAECLYLK